MGMRAWPLSVLLVALILALPCGAAAAPNCGEAPEKVGNTLVGTPCADTIHAPRGITTVAGEGGDDRSSAAAATSSLFGGEGNDRLYGGIGDDRLRGSARTRSALGRLRRRLARRRKRGTTSPAATPPSTRSTTAAAESTRSASPPAPRRAFPIRAPSSPMRGSRPAPRGAASSSTCGDGFANNGRALRRRRGRTARTGDRLRQFETVIGTAFPDYIVGNLRSPRPSTAAAAPT